MADALSMSMGGRIASIYRQNTKRRRFTTVINEIETKRLNFLKKQLDNDRATEQHRLERTTDKATNNNDELKAFQIALLRRIRAVHEESKITASTRPLLNLGRYGGASVEQVKVESDKFKRIRDPEKRRRIKARIYLEQGKRDGRIKTYKPEDVGNLAENILQLYKSVPYSPLPPVREAGDIANLEDVNEADDTEDDLQTTNVDIGRLARYRGHAASANILHKTFPGDSKITANVPSSFPAPSEMKAASQVKAAATIPWSSYPPNPPRKLTLPPMQIKRSLNPNSNYYRKVSAGHLEREAKSFNSRGLSPIHTRLSLLEDITDGEKTKRKNEPSSTKARDLKTKTEGSFPVTSLQAHQPTRSNEPHLRGGTKGYEWNHSKTIGPLRVGKHLNDSQKFWKPRDSVPFPTKKRVVLPKIA